MVLQRYNFTQAGFYNYNELKKLTKQKIHRYAHEINEIY